MLLVRILFHALPARANTHPAAGRSEAAKVACSLYFHFGVAVQPKAAATQEAEVY